jgi:hypothetical protein
MIIILVQIVFLRHLQLEIIVGALENLVEIGGLTLLVGSLE